MEHQSFCFVIGAKEPDRECVVPDQSLDVNSREFARRLRRFFGGSLAIKMKAFVSLASAADRGRHSRAPVPWQQITAFAADFALTPD
jgi:hypothetical protein